MEEVWKDIKGYEGLYQVSSYGRVKTLARLVIDSIGRETIRKEKVLSTRPSSQTGYPTINLFKDGKRTTVNVHRLVAEAFIPNPNNLPCVNHKDESRNNNFVDNLEWCTYRYNNTYGTVCERKNKSLAKFYDSHDEYLSPVDQYSTDGKLIRQFKSIRDAERSIGIEGSTISPCCHRKIKTAAAAAASISGTLMFIFISCYCSYNLHLHLHLHSSSSSTLCIAKNANASFA